MTDSTWTTPMGSLALWVPVRFSEWGAVTGHGTRWGSEVGVWILLALLLYDGSGLAALFCLLSSFFQGPGNHSPLPSSSLVVLTCPLLLAPG